MDAELLGKLRDGPIAFDGGKRHLRLESRAVVPARSSCHGPRSKHHAAVARKIHLSRLFRFPEPPLSRKASSQDNAACEGFFGRLKTEFFYPRDWRALTAAQFIDEVDAYIRWYNETRSKMSVTGRLLPR